MASSNYTINIYNMMDGVASTFYLFQDVVSDGHSGSTHVVRAAPMTEGSKDGSTMITFGMERQFYAVAGSAYSNSHDTIGVRTMISAPAQLGPRGSVFALTSKDGKYPTWDDGAVGGRTCEQPGGFQIITDDSFAASDLEHIFMGVGMLDTSSEDRVIPVETWPAERNVTFTIFPKVAYYIAKGDFRPGDTVDVTTLGRYIKIDFDGATSTVAYLVYNPNGTYSDDRDFCASHGIRLTSEG